VQIVIRNAEVYRQVYGATRAEETRPAEPEGNRALKAASIRSVKAAATRPVRARVNR
jgi:hypothetical protein